MPAEHLNILNGTTGEPFLPLYGGMGFIARLGGARSGELVIATRGTTMCLSDIITDVSVASERSPAGHPVHTGFLKTFKSYMAQLKGVLSHQKLGFRPTAIHCMGHSLGGALANLNAAACAELGFNTFLYSVAAPRVGMVPFAEHLSRKVQDEQVFRVANTSDPVTMLPCFPYVHSPYSHGHYLLEGGVMVNVSNHFMESGYSQMRSKSWTQLRSGTLAAQARLQFEVDQLIRGSSSDMLLGNLMMYTPIHSSRTLKRAAYVLNTMCRDAGAQHLLSLSFYATGAFTALDQTAEILFRATGLTQRAQENMQLAVGLMDGFLGRVQRRAADVSVAVLREVLNLLGTTLAQMAQQAIAQNLRM